MIKKLIVTLVLIITFAFSINLFSCATNGTIKYFNINTTINEIKELNNDFASIKFSNKYQGAGSLTQSIIDSSKLLSDNDVKDIFLIDSSLYQYDGAISKNPDTFNDVTISKNYFNYFEIYDVNNNKIVINPNENRGILLVPEKYKYKEVEINRYFRNIRNEYLNIDKENFNENNRENYYDLTIIPQEGQEKAVFDHDGSENINKNVSDDIVIYYIKDDQYLQTFNTNLKSTRIKNPIINVFSDNNIVISKMNDLSSEGLYIALDGMTFDEKYASILDTLKKYNLSERYEELVALDYTANIYKEIYFECAIINSILFLITFICSILLIHFFIVKFYKSNLLYSIAIFIISAFSIYISNFVSRLYIHPAIYSIDEIHRNSYIFIVIIFLLVSFICKKKCQTQSKLD